MHHRYDKYRIVRYGTIRYHTVKVDGFWQSFGVGLLGSIIADSSMHEIFFTM